MARQRKHHVFALLIFLSLCNEYIFQTSPNSSQVPPVESSISNSTTSQKVYSYPYQIRIAGGRNANPGEVPYQVSIKTAHMIHNCGGCLLNKQWILTAAHCLGPSAAYVTMGTINLKSGGITTGVLKYITHPQHDQTLRTNDIGLLKLDRPVEFDQYIQPLSLPTTNIDDNTLFTISGWGYLRYPNGQLSDYLQLLDVRSISNDNCAEKWSPYKIFPSNLCTLATAGKGFCKGDSGGPLVSNSEVHGIVSYGAACAINIPDIYSRVYYYIDWINETINSN